MLKEQIHNNIRSKCYYYKIKDIAIFSRKIWPFFLVSHMNSGVLSCLKLLGLFEKNKLKPKYIVFFGAGISEVVNTFLV